jgi:hypothetical protein
MTVQPGAGYEGAEPFPDAGGPPRTVASAVRVAVTLPTRLNDRRRDHGRARSLPVLQDSEALLPPASRLTVNNVHVTVNSVARN